MLHIFLDVQTLEDVNYIYDWEIIAVFNVNVCSNCLYSQLQILTYNQH